MYNFSYPDQLAWKSSSGAGPAAPEAKASKPSVLGVSLEYLIKFTDVNECWDMTTREVVEKVIKRDTMTRQCKYLELIDSKHTGQADVFLSHCWGSVWGDTLAACNHEMDSRTKVWVDIFMVTQWPGRSDDELAFEKVVPQCGSVLLACSAVEDLNALPVSAIVNPPPNITQVLPFCRVWCLVEIVSSYMNKVPLVMRLGTRNKQSSDTATHRDFLPAKGGLIANNLFHKLTRLVNIEKRSYASVEDDKMRILKWIESKVGLAVATRYVVGAITGAEHVKEAPMVGSAVLSGMNEAAKQKLRQQLEGDSKDAKLLLQAATIGAAAGGFQNVLRFLLSDLKADPNSEDKNAWSALMASCQGGHLECLNMLLEAGANASHIDKTNWSALDFAVHNGDAAVISAIKLAQKKSSRFPGKSARTGRLGLGKLQQLFATTSIAE
eukprot:g70333.t1